jgi:hypothetical protein
MALAQELLALSTSAGGVYWPNYYSPATLT